MVGKKVVNDIQLTVAASRGPTGEPLLMALAPTVCGMRSNHLAIRLPSMGSFSNNKLANSENHRSRWHPLRLLVLSYQLKNKILCSLSLRRRGVPNITLWHLQ